MNRSMNFCWSLAVGAGLAALTGAPSALAVPPRAPDRVVITGPIQYSPDYREIELPASAAHAERTFSLDQAGGMGLRAPDASAAFSNVTTFTGFTVNNGGATTGNQITFLVCDKITLRPGSSAAGAVLNTVRWAVGNNDTAGVQSSARMRLRWFDSNGPGGGPGTNFAGFSFGATTETGGGGTLWNSDFTANAVHPPSDTIWVGITFDNVTANATVAQLNLRAQFTVAATPDVGVDSDDDWVSTAAGSNLVNNPAGAIRTSPFGAAPVANYAWEFVMLNAPGACCTAGSCAIIGGTGVTNSNTQCTGGGGTWQGYGSTCTPNPCTLPQACCTNGTCGFVANQAACSGAGQTFMGGSTCTGIQCPCDLVLPTVDNITVFSENETCVTAGADTVNGGCRSGSPVYTTVPCGNVTFVGTAWAGPSRDEDDYLVTLPVAGTVTASLHAEFESGIWLVSLPCPNNIDQGGDLGIAAILATSFNNSTNCTGNPMVTMSLPAGQYAVIVTPNRFAGMPCGNVAFPHNDYFINIVTDPCGTAGRCCNGASCTVTLSTQCSGTFTAGANCNGSLEFSSDNTIYKIPSNNPNLYPDSIISVNSGANPVITSIEVDVNLSHSYIGDLQLSLRRGAVGTPVFLLNRPGFPGTTTAAGASTTMPAGVYTFNDTSGPDLWTSCQVAADPNYTASLTPGTFHCSDNNNGTEVVNNFSSLAGNINGDWYVSAVDVGTGNAVVGAFNGWKIRFNGGGAAPCAPTQVRCCFPNGSCSMVNVGACVGGTEGVSGSTCSPNTCPQPAIGACCVGAVCTTNVAQNSCSGTFDAGNSCALVAAPPHSFCCPHNYNRDGQKDVADIFAELAGWFTFVPAADWDGNGLFQVGDIFFFIGGWFAPC